MSIPTIRKMLQLLYDVLEALRYLRFECNVLHCDISAGNVMYTEDPSSNAPHIARAQAQANPLPDRLPVFIKYLLRESDDRQQTSMLLIDFNHGALLNEKQGFEHNRVDRAGTPVFIARAVEEGGPVPLPEIAVVPAVPRSPEWREIIEEWT